MINIKSTISQLCLFISKMMNLIEEQIIDIENDQNNLKSNIKTKSYKEITKIFERLVSLILILNKLSKEEQMNLDDSLPEEDQAILNRYIAKYLKESNHVQE